MFPANDVTGNWPVWSVNIFPDWMLLMIVARTTCSCSGGLWSTACSLWTMLVLLTGCIVGMVCFTLVEAWFFCDWSKWPLWVAGGMVSYLLNAFTVKPGHDIKNSFLMAFNHVDFAGLLNAAAWK